jgi:hypothetical protein
MDQKEGESKDKRKLFHSTVATKNVILERAKRRPQLQQGGRRKGTKKELSYFLMKVEHN